MSVVIGFVLIVALAFFHYGGMVAMDRINSDRVRRLRIYPVIAFSELAVIHFSEIVLFALAYVGLAAWVYPDSFGGAFEGRWTDWLYFSGINFATLGYTGIDIAGPLRIVSMMQSLLGFMLLTWSATFLYDSYER